MHLIKKAYVGFMRIIVGSAYVAKAYISGFIEGYKKTKEQ
jgi:hypothetical protein